MDFVQITQWKMAQFKWKMAQFKLYLADAIFSTEINEKWHNLNEKWHSPESSQNQWGRAMHCKHCAPWSTLFCYGLSCVPRTNTPAFFTVSHRSVDMTFFLARSAANEGNCNWELWDLVITFDWWVLLTQRQCVWIAFCKIFWDTPIDHILSRARGK